MIAAGAGRSIDGCRHSPTDLCRSQTLDYPAGGGGGGAAGADPPSEGAASAAGPLPIALTGAVYVVPLLRRAEDDDGGWRPALVCGDMHEPAGSGGGGGGGFAESEDVGGDSGGRPGRGPRTARDRRREAERCALVDLYPPLEQSGSPHFSRDPVRVA